jgi:hypothetical protein
MVPVVVSSSLDVILNVLPSVDIDHVNELLNQHDHNVTVVIDILADNPAYPKSTSAAIVHLDDDNNNNNNQNHKDYDYYMSSQSFFPNKIYIKEAIEQLHTDFPFLSYYGRKSILLSCHNHYAICYDNILNVLKDTGDSTNSPITTPVVRSVDDANVQRVVYNQIVEAQYNGILSNYQITKLNRLAGITSIHSILLWKSAVKICNVRRNSNKRRTKTLTITHSILQDEIQCVHDKTNDWMDSMRIQMERIDRQEESKQNNTAIECACCYDSYHINDVIACEDTTRDYQHLFCYDCIRSMIETKIFSDGNLGYESWSKELALDLQCFHNDGCIFSFSRTQLEKVLSTSTMTKYTELQQQLSITKAGLATVIHSCPKCYYKCEVPPTETILNCPVSTCQYISCIKCKEISHGPDDCSTFKIQTYGRLSVEEAISSVRIRKCPVCTNSFIKIDGCNQVRCSCGILICYLCKQNIANDGYDHFCNRRGCNHSTCNKCGLYTNTDDDDRIAMRQAGLEASLQNRDAKIGIDQILQLISDNLQQTPIAAGVV